jgi:hypothetical protein
MKILIYEPCRQIHALYEDILAPLEVDLLFTHRLDDAYVEALLGSPELLIWNLEIVRYGKSAHDPANRATEARTGDRLHLRHARLHR